MTQIYEPLRLIALEQGGGGEVKAAVYVGISEGDKGLNFIQSVPVTQALEMALRPRERADVLEAFAGRVMGDG